MKRNFGSCLLAALILQLLFCRPILGTDIPAQDKISPQDVCITVFVHGIISIKPHITVTNFMRFLTDNVHDSPYGETVLVMRDDKFFFQNQTIQARGLVPIDIANIDKGATASLMANLYEKVSQISGIPPSKNHYYTYGWSGLLSRSARYNDAREFLLALQQELAKYKAAGINAKIRLIGYSHGGTIILKLAMAKQLENINPDFHIDEVVLLGTPIQYDTDYLIADPLFKKVYNIFSRSDRVQKLDFFSCGQFFSDHVFSSHFGFETLPEKLTQIEIRVIRKSGDGCTPIRPEDASLPLLYDGIRCKKTVRNVSPGHSELWFFGWTPLHYRKSFPLYPLPIVAFVPFILSKIKPLESNFSPCKPVSVTIDPRRNSMIIKNNLCMPQIFKTSFLGINEFLALREQALAYQPDLTIFNYLGCSERIGTAYKNALALLQGRRCKKQPSAIKACKK